MDDIMFSSAADKMTMSLEDIIKQGGKKAPRAVGKQATMNKNTAGQRKQQQAQNATKNARAQRQKSIVNKRGMTQSPQAQQNGQSPQQKKGRAFPVRAPRSNVVGGRLTWQQQQRMRITNANKKTQQQPSLTRGQTNDQQGTQKTTRRPENFTINLVNDQFKKKEGNNRSNTRQSLKQMNTPQRGARGTRGTRGNARASNVVASRQQNQQRQASAVNQARGINNANRTVVSQDNGAGNSAPSTLNDRFSNAPQNRQVVQRSTSQQGNRSRGGAGRQQRAGRQQGGFGRQQPAGRQQTAGRQQGNGTGRRFTNRG